MGDWGAGTAVRFAESAYMHDLDGAEALMHQKGEDRRVSAVIEDFGTKVSFIKSDLSQFADECTEREAVVAQLKEISAYIDHAVTAVGSTRQKRSTITGLLWSALIAVALSLWAIAGYLWPIDETADTALDCWKVGNELNLIAALMAIWLSSKIARYKLLPQLYPNTFAVMSSSKRDKAVGNLVKAIGRLMVMVFLTHTWTHFSLEHGLEMGPRTTPPGSTSSWCSNHSDATTRRLFYGGKNMMLALMVWELGFLSSLSWDMWLHHLTIIVLVVGTTDPSLPLVPGDTPSFSAMNGIGMIIIYGTAFVGLKELAVLRFQHCTARQMAYQFVCLRWAVIVHVINQAVFYFALPVLYTITAVRAGNIPIGRAVLLGAITFFLNALELYIGYITYVVMKSRQRKAAIVSAFSLSVDTTALVPVRSKLDSGSEELSAVTDSATIETCSEPLESSDDEYTEFSLPESIDDMSSSLGVRIED